jgi:8-oxo-dGTP pyrophosphatase MutT (NUDIX family)
VYENRWVKLGLADVQTPDGRRFEHHVVHLDHVAIAVLMDQQDRVLMLWRYRFVVDQWGYELLGGIGEPGEDAATTAAREAEEESDYRPVGEPEHVSHFQPMPGMVDAPVDIFLWREFDQVGEPSDPEEAAIMRWVPLTELPQLVANNEILGVGTLVAVLHLLHQASLGD